jgi:hypothetical protein
MPHHGHGSRGTGHHAAAQQGSPAGRLGGAMNTVLKASIGAGLAVLGAYVLQRGSQHSDLAARIERLDALVKDMEKKGGNGSAG